MKPKLAYTLLDEITASPTQPIKEESRRLYLGKLWDGFRRLTGDTPTYKDVDLCVDVIGMVESLIALGVANDEGSLINDARSALGHCVKFYPDGPVLPLQPERAHLVRAVLEDYTDLMSILPARVMIRCHRNAERSRAEEIKRWRIGK